MYFYGKELPKITGQHSSTLPQKNMNITIIGSGNVGGTLAVGFRKAGHSVILGVKDPALPFKGKDLALEYNFPFYAISEAVQKSDVIVIAAPAHFAHEIAQTLGDVKGKVIIDTMNAVMKKPANYATASEAILENCNSTDVVKCFNSTGAENIANPNYDGVALDMFMAGDSAKGKLVAAQLAKDIGFANCYDFGGNDKFALLEQFAFAWINLAIMQKQGRNFGFKILKR
jgi:8-hydroxy-5-deazaflavin:NADPH oxidoreductase